MRRLCLFIIDHSNEILARGRFGWSSEKKKANGLLLQQWLRSEKMSLLLERRLAQFEGTPAEKVVAHAIYTLI